MMNPIERLFKRRTAAYRTLFNEQDANSRIVMTDLKRFCRYNKSTFHTDPNQQSYLNGRRDVMERIFLFLDLTQEQINSIKEE